MRVSSWRVKWARSAVAMGLVRERGEMWWNMVPASRWARTRQMSVRGKEPRGMMDFMGHWLFVVEIVWMCVMAMWPL
jgi:hypothetical protein